MNEVIKKAKELIEGQISCAKDDLQHYTMIDFDSAKAKQSEFDLRDLNIVKSALNLAEDISDLKNIHNTKVKEPLCDVFQRLGFDKETRYAYIEHIYYSYHEMKETLEKQLEDTKKQAEEEHKELVKLRRFAAIMSEWTDNYEDEIEIHVDICNNKEDREEFNFVREVTSEYAKKED